MTIAESHLNDCLEVRASQVEGSGLFATRDIQSGEVLIVYGGRLINDVELEALQPHSTLAVAEGLHLVQEDTDAAQYVNHSCDSNAWMEDAVTMVARRRIESGEEVTLDYALVSVAPAWLMTCTCRALDCRGTVAGSDWQRPDVQCRYRHHFSPFINERIQNLSKS